VKYRVDTHLGRLLAAADLERHSFGVELRVRRGVFGMKDFNQHAAKRPHIGHIRHVLLLAIQLLGRHGVSGATVRTNLGQSFGLRTCEEMSTTQQ
jgi:hypothetical protein